MPQLARTGSARLLMIDQCAPIGRLRSPSSAARRSGSTNSENADKVKLSASTMPTERGDPVRPRLSMIRSAIREDMGTRAACQQAMKFTASPPSEVSLYLRCMSAPVWRMVAIT